MREYDIPYAYDLFNRITSSATVNGQALSAILLDDRHNLWHCFAQAAFIEDCVAFSITKEWRSVATSYRVAHEGNLSLKYFLAGGCAFLVTLISLVGLRLGPARVLIYSVDRLSPRGRFDFRMERVYRELENEKLPYVEVFHTVIGKRFLTNLYKRRRSAIYLEGLEWAFYLLRSVKRLFGGRTTLTIGGLEGFSEDERFFAVALVNKFMSIAPLVRYRADLLTRALRGRIRAVFTIDDARHYHEVLIAARRLKVRSYAFQHSHLTPYHVGWLADTAYRGEYVRTDYFITWNEYWKEEMLALNSVWTEGAIVIGGSPKETSVFAATRAAPNTRPYTVVMPYETHAPHHTARRVLERFLECTDISVVIKIRPDLPRESQLAFFGPVPSSVRVITNLTELKEPITAVIGTYSTFLYDAAEAGLPVGLIRTPLQYTKRMLLNGLAEDVTVDGACAAVERLAALTREDIAFRQKILAEAGQLPTLIANILKDVNAVG